MTRLGPLVGVGRTSEVFAYGNGSVVKLLRPGMPSRWAGMEAEYAAAVHETGVPVPAVGGVIDVDGRSGVVFERIDGPSMWSRMVETPTAAKGLARELAAIHRLIQAQAAPDVLPELTDRIGRKIAEVESLTAAERAEARSVAARLEKGRSLYHGDVHPGNVVMSPDGPVVIDWFDAASGSPIADIVRTSLLIRPPADPATRHIHLPGATVELLSTVHREYLRTALVGQDISAEELRTWEAVLAAGRLAEAAERSTLGLVELWRRRDRRRSSMVDELSAIDLLDDRQD